MCLSSEAAQPSECQLEISHSFLPPPTAAAVSPPFISAEEGRRTGAFVMLWLLIEILEIKFLAVVSRFKLCLF